jgi:HAD superfamily hydrolase (TIGR01549 family)
VSSPKLSLEGIRAILFDLDGTLRHNRPSYNDAFFDFCAELGVPDSRENQRRALRWAHYYFAGSAENAADRQRLGHDEDLFLTNYVHRWLIAYGCAPARATDLAPDLYQRMKEAIQPTNWVDPEAPQTLKRLKEAGFTLGVVSNRSEAFDDLMNELDLARYFEFAVAAGEVGSWKPDKGIFLHAIERAGSCPECTIYVGDNYFADVVGAQSAGLRPVLLDPEGVFPDAECPVIRSLSELQNGLIRVDV